MDKARILQKKISNEKFRPSRSGLRVNKQQVIMARLQFTLESGIDVGQGINIGPGKFVKNNKRRALNKRRA